MKPQHLTSHLTRIGFILALTWNFTMMSPVAASEYQQSPDQLLDGEVMAIAYSGYRQGQYPDRGNGDSIHPTDEQVLQDLEILVDHNFKLIRMYGSGEHAMATLRLIEQHKLPIRMMLGIWLKAEVSNHEGCPWLHEPIPEPTLAANKLDNAAEIDRAIKLANQYPDIVMSVNVGNEALVDWNDHMVSRDAIIQYVRQVKAAIPQPVTVADNYLWWIQEGRPLADEVDFIGVHTYPVWENKPIEEGLSYTIQNIEDVHRTLPDKPIAILEAGWATTASEFSEQASEENQVRYYRELRDWATKTNTTVFFFEAFDEPWKGNPDNAQGAEKHWGLFFEDRTPKAVVPALVKPAR